MQCGILFPLSSFPGNHGIGDLGKNAYKLIDCLAKNNIQYLQILPFHPSTQANSPYRAVSTFAGDEMYIDLDELVDQGLIDSIMPYPKNTNRVDYEKVREFKHKYLLKAYTNFRPDLAYQQFLDNCSWVFDYAIYCTFAKLNNSYDWSSWPSEYKNYPQELRIDLKEYQDTINYYLFTQYIFYQQWFDFKNYANKNQIKIIGDMPFYVDHGSVEVWLDKASFLLDEDGKPTDVAGVPPDYFSPTGQYWGNPIYDWEYMKNNNFEFWCQRIGWASKIFDITRIDHFRAFDSYWDIPVTATSAIDGYWRYAPGYELFDCLYQQLGSIELVAEDLGYLRPEVITLKEHYHLKGMKVFQFMLDEGFEDIGYNFFYTGTHDNETLRGWVNNLDYDARVKLATLVGDNLPLNLEIIKYCLHSQASDVIIPIWDLLEVDNSQRFNVPGEVNETNWTYRVADLDLACKGIYLFKKLKEEL